MVRFCDQHYEQSDTRVQDFPVFNGRYSTACYIDETLHALQNMYERRKLQGIDYLRSLKYIFMHRPYKRMPETGMAIAYLAALSTGSAVEQDEFAALANEAGVPLSSAKEEFSADRAINQLANPDCIGIEAYPSAMAVLHVFRRSETYQKEVLDKLSLGSESNSNLGNLYTAALPAWLAAGFEVALDQGLELAGEELLTMGYGSGDAAEVIPFHVVDGWRDAVAAIGFADAMEYASDLTRDQYEALHDRRPTSGLVATEPDVFVVDRVGTTEQRGFSDVGIEYHALCGAKQA